MPNNIFVKGTRQFLTLLATLPLLIESLGAVTTTDEMLTQLQLDYAAFKAAEEDYRALREAARLVDEQASDYAAYLARLQRRVFEDCQAVIHSGITLPDDLPCPVIVPPVTQSADIAIESEQTLAEQIVSLDAELDKGLGEFDERLLQEQERIKAATPNTNSDNASGAGNDSEGSGQNSGAGTSGDGASGSNTSSSENEGRESEAAQRDAQPGAGDGNSRPGSGAPGKDSDQPADIPDGSDDDVVARQLREAAEKETDPELKAKLWEEYRNYKQGTG